MILNNECHKDIGWNNSIYMWKRTNTGTTIATKNTFNFTPIFTLNIIFKLVLCQHNVMLT